MSLAIEADDVAAVLLADGWHEVHPSTFTIDAYEFLDGAIPIHGGGNGGVCSSGFTFATDKGRLSGPLTAILAIRHAD